MIWPLPAAFDRGWREGIGEALSRKPGDLPDALLEIRSAPNRVVPLMCRLAVHTASWRTSP